MGEALCILKQAKEATPQATYEKAPQPPLPPNSTNQPAVTTQAKPARALSRLLPHNKPGLKELIPPKRPLPMGNGLSGGISSFNPVRSAMWNIG